MGVLCKILCLLALFNSLQHNLLHGHLTVIDFSIYTVYIYWDQSWRSGAKCDCKNRLVVGSVPTRGDIYLNLYFHFFALVSRLNAALSSATQHAMPPEFGRKWLTEYLNTRIPLPTLLCARYEREEAIVVHSHKTKWDGCRFDSHSVE